MWSLVIQLLFLNAIFASEKDWWTYTEIYEIVVPSFQDSNGDGIGDLKGITSRISHFVDLKIDAVWLTPFFKSPMVDFGYDISNYTDVDPLFGTLEDFDELSAELKAQGIKLFIDIVINHSSDEHPWFQKSINREEPYDKFYIWKDPAGYDSSGLPKPPNNWLSLFGGKAWQWNEKRQQFYYHIFSVKQPDFDLRNPILKEELKKMLKFWFDRGVTGLRLDATLYYMEDELFRDEPAINPEIIKEEYDYFDYSHIYTINLWGIYEFLHEIRLFVDDVNAKEGGFERIMVSEAYTHENYTVAYYGEKDYPIVHFPFNFKLIVDTVPSIFLNASSMKNTIDRWFEIMPEGGTPNWVAENHDRHRVGSRLTDEYSDIMTVLVMMLPGVACIYYGQEIGMLNGPLRSDQLIDTFDPWIKRDPARTPMQWDDSLNAGFSSKLTTRLPVNPDHWHVNVAAQKKSPNSRYNIFKTLSQIRKTETGKYGAFRPYTLSPWVYAFTRAFPGHDTYLIVINLGTEWEIVSLKGQVHDIPPLMKVVTGSPNSGYKKGDIIHRSSVFPRIFALKPLSYVILTSNLKEPDVAELQDKLHNANDFNI